MEIFSFSGSTIDDHTLVKEAKSGGHEPSRSLSTENANENGNKSSHEKVSKKKKGKSSANTKNNADDYVDSQDSAPTKSKRSQKKGKESQIQESKSGGKNLEDKAKEQNIPSEEWIMEKIMKMVPDFEEQGNLATIIIKTFSSCLQLLIYPF